MKKLLCVVITILIVSLGSSAKAEQIKLSIATSWTVDDFTVTDPLDPLFGTGSAYDGEVFGVAPSVVSTAVDFLVDSSSVIFLDAGYTYDDGLGNLITLAHDFYGYSNVVLADPTYTFGTATWDTSGITDLEGPDGLMATLWTDTDIAAGDPSLFSLRMQGTAPGLTADYFAGQRVLTDTEMFIRADFQLWEYFSGGNETIYTQSMSASVNAIPEPSTIALLGIGLVGLVGAKVRRRQKKDCS